MGTEEQRDELTDVALCYQAMGVPLDASPAKVEQMYKALLDDHKKKMASPDPGIREDARQGMELVNEMYGKIRSSITYLAMEKDSFKNKSAAGAAAIRPVHYVVAQRSLMTHCPRCNGSILKGDKICPICKTAIHTAAEKFLKTWFSPYKLVAYCVVLAVVSLGVFFFLQTDKPKADKMDLDFLEQKIPAK